MKRFIPYLLVLGLLVAATFVKAQTNVTTIVLLRHAEKDTAGGKDPQLSIAGQARARKLPVLFKNLKPDAMYSTPTIRTRQTLAPWAKVAKVKIEEYDPNNLQAFADKLKLMKGKTIVVCGHSNTTPILVNLLIGTNKYPALNDHDYSTLWVVEIKNGLASERVVKY